MFQQGGNLMKGLVQDINKMVKEVGLSNYNITPIVISELEEMVIAFDECNYLYEIELKILFHTRNIFRKIIKIVDDPEDITKASKLSKMIRRTILEVLSKSVA